MYRLTVLAALTGVLALLMPGCGSSANPSGSGTQTVGGACESVQESVTALYEKEPSPPKTSPEIRAELALANVHMVLSDCEKSPKASMACIRKATTVAWLEQNCLVPLDDEGTVEGRQFQ